MKSIKFFPLLFVLALLISCSVDGQDQDPKDLKYSDLVYRLTDMRKLATKPKKGETSQMWSSYDRDSKLDSATGKYVDWDANIDGLRPQYIRKEGDNEVLAEMNGPGAIVRIWSASPKEGKVKIYIDGKETPVVNESFIDYFKPSIPAFDFDGLVYQTSARGYNNYVPIPYQKSCKIVAEPGWGQYYQFNYISFLEGTEVEAFDPKLQEAQKSALTEVNDFFDNNLGKSPYKNEDFKTETKEINLPAGEKQTVIKLDGTGAITSLKIKVKDRDSSTIKELLRKNSIYLKWDGEEKASVWSPLGDFFGTSPGYNLYKTLPMGMTEDWMYSYWYMPYEKGAELILENDFDQPVSLSVEVKYENLENTQNLTRFHAKWHRDLEPYPEDRWPDWRWLDTEGTGRFVGAHLLVWNPKGGSCSLAGPGYWWWGEGDEKFFVDGEKFPSTFGTGTEDYFGYAWCDPAKFERAFHSQTLNNDNMGYQPMNRWQIIDNVPFQKSFNASLEKYFPNDWPTQYATVVYWYLNSGGTDPLNVVPLDKRYGYETQYDVLRVDKAVEGENLKIVSNSTDRLNQDAFANEKLYKNVSGHKIMIWWALPDNKNVLKTQFTWPKTGKYDVYANFIKAQNSGKFKITLNGKLSKTFDLKTDGDQETMHVKLGTMTIKGGTQNLEVKYAGDPIAKEKDSLLFLDYLQFEEK